MPDCKWINGEKIPLHVIENLVQGEQELEIMNAISHSAHRVFNSAGYVSEEKQADIITQLASDYAKERGVEISSFVLHQWVHQFIKNWDFSFLCNP